MILLFFCLVLSELSILSFLYNILNNRIELFLYFSVAVEFVAANISCYRSTLRDNSSD